MFNLKIVTNTFSCIHAGSVSYNKADNITSYSKQYLKDGRKISQTGMINRVLIIKGIKHGRIPISGLWGPYNSNKKMLSSNLLRSVKYSNQVLPPICQACRFYQQMFLLLILAVLKVDISSTIFDYQVVEYQTRVARLKRDICSSITSSRFICIYNFIYI